MKKGIFRCMDFDTNHPKLIIAAVACDRNGLTNEAAAFSVRLSAFFIRRTPQVIFGFALKSNILNTSFLSSRQSMRTSPFIFKACDAATQSSFILTSPLCCLLQAVRFVDTKSQVSSFSLPNFLFQRYFIADTVGFQGYRPYGRQAKSHSCAI